MQELGVVGNLPARSQCVLGRTDLFAKNGIVSSEKDEKGRPGAV
jgi:type III secretory pathway lipoprotein EscJ